jgi:hypothetical protein
LEVSATIFVPIVGQVGEVRYEAYLKDLNAWKTEDGIKISAHLVNTGTGRLGLKGDYEILNGSGDVVSKGLIGDDTVLAGGERLFIQTAKGDYPDSEYVVRVRYGSTRIEETLAGQTRVALASPVQEEPASP